MDSLNTLFRQRIGISANEVIHFGNLDIVLEKTARAIPFENICVINKTASSISRENLIDKIVNRNEGGLCYELNTILHLFLLENGLKSSIVRGIVYNHKEQQWSVVGSTHVFNLVTNEGKQYIVDTGFGANIPLKPIPLDGTIVESNNGQYRVQQKEDKYYLYMKLTHKQEDWKVGYAFDITDKVNDFSILNEVQRLIVEHPDSTLNKKILLSKIDERGMVILTDTSFTIWNNGNENKQEVDKAMFKKLLEQEFHISY